MKKIINSILILSILVMLSACGASKKSNYHLVRHHQPRQSSLGFSVSPPPGKNWFETLKKDSLMYLKISKATAHSYSILTEAREVRLPKAISNPREFYSHVQKEKNGSLVSADIKEPLSSFAVESSISDFCVRFNQSYQDHSLQALQGRRYVKVNTTGLYCRHPKKPSIAIEVSYLEKSVSGAKTPSYKKEGEQFLASLSFHAGNRNL